MTEDYSVQKRPSALPYLAVGGGVGALGGFELAKRANFGIRSTRYASFDDILKEKKDTFDALKKKVNDGSNEELKTAVTKVEEAKNKFVTDVQGYIKDNKPAWDEKIANEGSKLDAANKSLSNKIKELTGNLEKDSDGKLTEAAQKKFNEVKDLLKKAKGEAATGEESAVTELRKLLKDQETARKTLQDKAKEKGVEAHKVVKDLETKLGEFKKSAWEGVQENAKKLKGSSKLWTAVVGGVVLATLAAVLFRPKAKQEAQ